MRHFTRLTNATSMQVENPEALLCFTSGNTTTPATIRPCGSLLPWELELLITLGAAKKSEIVGLLEEYSN